MFCAFDAINLCIQLASKELGMIQLLQYAIFDLFASSALEDEGRLTVSASLSAFFKAEIIQCKGLLWHSGLTNVSSPH